MLHDLAYTAIYVLVITYAHQQLTCEKYDLIRKISNIIVNDNKTGISIKDNNGSLIYRLFITIVKANCPQ